ncbi:MAG: hypothetical protein Q4D56_04555 [Bacteroides sp.]|nr:hypothetical protein [Bacteroides sp.]
MKQSYYLPILLLLLAACMPDTRYNTLLVQADSLMQTKPDSALLLLQDIRPEDLQAVDYYRGSKDKAKSGRAFLYYGKVMDYNHRETAAMQAYLDAQTALADTREYKLLALVHQYIGSMNDDRGMYDMALDNYQQSIAYSRKAKDTLKMIYSYRNIAWLYEAKQNYDSAALYAQTGLSLLKDDSLSPVYPSLQHLIGEQEKRRKNYSQAIARFRSAIRNEQVDVLLHYYYMSLGDAYLQIGKLQEAEEVLKKLMASDNCHILAGAYNYLYLLEKERAHHTLALSYKEKSDSLESIWQDAERRSQTVSLQQKYESDRLTMQNKLIAQQKETQQYIWISLFLLLVSVGIICYRGIRRQYRKIYKRRLSGHLAKELEKYRKNEQTIHAYAKQIEDLKQEAALSARNVKEEIGRLNGKILILTNENKAIRQNTGVSAPYYLQQLKKGLLLVENMSVQEKADIFDYIDLLSGNFATRLRNDYKLTEGNLMLAVLMKLGFSNTELAIAFDCEENSVYRKKQRLKEKLHLSKQDDWAAFFNSNPLYLSTEENK